MVGTKYYCFYLLMLDAGCWILVTYLLRVSFFIMHSASSIYLLEYEFLFFVIIFEHAYKLQVPSPPHYPISGYPLRLSHI